MKEIGLTLLAVIALSAAAVGVVCTVGVARIAKTEAEDEDRKIQDDRFTASYWDEHDASGLIEED